MNNKIKEVNSEEVNSEKISVRSWLDQFDRDEKYPKEFKKFFNDVNDLLKLDSKEMTDFKLSTDESNELMIELFPIVEMLSNKESKFTETDILISFDKSKDMIEDYKEPNSKLYVYLETFMKSKAEERIKELRLTDIQYFDLKLRTPNNNISIKEKVIYYRDQATSATNTINNLKNKIASSKSGMNWN